MKTLPQHDLTLLELGDMLKKENASLRLHSSDDMWYAMILAYVTEGSKREVSGVGHAATAENAVMKALQEVENRRKAVEIARKSLGS